MVALYKYVVPKPREQCTKTEQLGVSFLAGYIAGARGGEGVCVARGRGRRGMPLRGRLFCAAGACAVGRAAELELGCGPGAAAAAAFRWARCRRRRRPASPTQSPLTCPGTRPPGVFCAAVSHPADNLVSKLNAQKGATAGDIVKQVRAHSPRGTQRGGSEGRACRPSVRASKPLLPSPRPTKPCLSCLSPQMGVWNLMTRGLPLRIIMVGTLTGLQWGERTALKMGFSQPAPRGLGWSYVRLCLCSLGPRPSVARGSSSRANAPRLLQRPAPTSTASRPPHPSLTPPTHHLPPGIYDAFKVYSGLPTTGAAVKK